MEIKRVVISSALAIALFAGWFFFITWANKKYGPPADQTAQNPTGTTSSPAAAVGTQPTATATTTAATAQGAVAVSQPAGLQLLAGGDTRKVNLGSAKHDDAQFAIQLNT